MLTKYSSSKRITLEAELAESHAIVVDLTSAEVVAAAVPEASRPFDMSPEVKFPCAVAFRLQEGELKSFAGKQLVNLVEDDQTILFDYLHEDLHRLEDAELQDHLIETLWQALFDSATETNLISPPGKTLAFLTTPITYPQTLLERFRRRCGQKDGLVLGGCINEALALTIGFLRSPYLSEVKDGPEPRKFNLLVATASGVEVVAITYRKVAGSTRHHVGIREFFRTSYEKLAARLQGFGGPRSTDSLISLESNSTDSQQRATLEIVLPSTGFSVRHQTDDADWLKGVGAAYIAKCSLGHGDIEAEFFITAPTNIGVQLNQRVVCPVVHKDDLIKLEQFPYQASRTFAIRGASQQDVEINLYSGFSSRVAESVLLASGAFPARELNSKRNSAVNLVVSVILESAGSGVFKIGLPSGEPVTSDRRFTLPGLVV